MTHPESVPPPTNPPASDEQPQKVEHQHYGEKQVDSLQQQVEYYGRVWGLRGSAVATQLALIAAAERHGLKITFGDVHRRGLHWRGVWRWVYAEGIDYTTKGYEPVGTEWSRSATTQFALLVNSAFGKDHENRMAVHADPDGKLRRPERRAGR